MKKSLKLSTLAVLTFLLAMGLAACGDPTATTVPATTAAPAATTAASVATTAAPAATTAAPAATTASSVATTAAPVATTVAAPAATTAAASGATSGTIRIYSSLPLTGSSKEQTETMVNAMKLALDDFTAGTKKIGDFTIDYVSLDDATAAKGQWDADQEKANANKAVNDTDAMAYLGTYNSGAAKIAMPITNAANLIMISPANSLACLTKFDAGSGCDKSEPAIYFPNGIRNYVRLATTDDLQGPGGANYMATTLKVTKVYVVDDSQAYGKGLADAFAASAPGFGMEVTGRASINGKESDYKALASTIKAKAPGGIYFGGITQQQAGKLIADLRAAGITVPFVGGDGIQEAALIKDAGIAAEGVYASAAGVGEEQLPDKGKDFLKRYRAKFGEPEVYTTYAYDTMGVALAAIKKVGKKDRAAIRDAIASTKSFEGVLGTWSFDANGDLTPSGIKMNQVKDGKWIYLGQTKPTK